MIISISGLDGSGKSTQIDLLVKYFTDRKIKCRVRHLIRDSLTYFITHKIIGFFSERTKSSMEEGIRKKEKGVSFYILAFIKKILLVVELLYFNVRYGCIKNKEGSVIICDRYYYDAIVQMEFLGIAGRAFIKFYRKMIIQPDLSFYIKVDPYTAYERKSEFNVDYFTKKEKLYNDVFPGNTVVVERGSIEEVKNCIYAGLKEAK